jgi:hypothetical protein
MTEAVLEASPAKVLEIGTGSGYQAAILAALGLEVHTVERIGELLRTARKRFRALGMNVRSKHDDGRIGWPENGPFDAIVVTPIRVLFLLILAGSAYAFVARRSWERFVMKRIQRNLCDHILVAGFGTKNSRAVQELVDMGTVPNYIVVIDTNYERLEKAKALGCTVLRADATRDEKLRAIRIERAKLLIISAGRDDTSILICLTARHHAPNLRISVAVNAEDNVMPAKRAGATS